MKHLFFLNLLTIIALLTACQKIDVEPGGGSPVFSADFTVNGEVKNWQAGVDSFYLFADFEKGADDVFVFTGELKKENCSTGCESLKIYIRDFQQLVQGNPIPWEALKIGFYLYAEPPGQDTVWQVISDTVYNLSFDASPSIFPSSAPGGQYSWVLGNGLAANGLQVNFDSMNLDMPLSMMLNAVANNAGCSGSQMQTISKDANPVAGGNCAVQIKEPDTISSQLIAETTGVGPFSFLWSTGDSSDTITIPIFQNAVSVTVTSANGCTSSASVNFVSNPGTLPQICSAGFTYQIQPVQKDRIVMEIHPGDTLQLGKVIVEYTNSDGVRFRSDLAQQKQEAFFEIQSVEDYEENEFGQPTKKLKVAFSCQLAGTNIAPGILIIEGTAVIAVAHP